MPRYNKREDFESGLAQLVPFFDSLGFSLFRAEPSSDKEGTSYSARFDRLPRSIEVSHLYSLGPVIYSVREFSVEHTYYIQALGASAAARFPSFVDDSISGYPALLHDLQELMTPFFTGPENDFMAIAARHMEEQRQRQEHDGRELKYQSTGEDRLKARARELFMQGHYNDVARLESEIRFPELLTDSERQLFALARKRKQEGRDEK